MFGESLGSSGVKKKKKNNPPPPPGNFTIEEDLKSIISTQSGQLVSHTCSLEVEKESATPGSKLLSSSMNTSGKTSMSV